MIMQFRCLVLMKNSALRFQLKLSLLLKAQEQFWYQSISQFRMWTICRFDLVVFYSSIKDVVLYFLHSKINEFLGMTHSLRKFIKGIN